MDTIAILRDYIGRRHRITPAEMIELLTRLGAAGLDLGNGYVSGTVGRRWDEPASVEIASAAWEAACRDITIVCLQSAGLDDGCVRYDQAGSMHPKQRSEIIFARRDAGRGGWDYLRRRCARLLIVDDAAASAAA